MSESDGGMGGDYDGRRCRDDDYCYCCSPRDDQKDTVIKVDIWEVIAGLIIFIIIVYGIVYFFGHMS